jgi:hypothetical protein
VVAATAAAVVIAAIVALATAVGSGSGAFPCLSHWIQGAHWWGAIASAAAATANVPALLPATLAALHLFPVRRSKYRESQLSDDPTMTRVSRQLCDDEEEPPR